MPWGPKGIFGSLKQSPEPQSLSEKAIFTLTLVFSSMLKKLKLPDVISTNGAIPPNSETIKNFPSGVRAKSSGFIKLQ